MFVILETKRGKIKDVIKSNIKKGIMRGNLKWLKGDQRKVAKTIERDVNIQEKGTEESIYGT